MIRLTFPNGEIAEFEQGAPMELIEGVKSAYNRFGSLKAVDQWRRMESLRSDQGFLSLPRIERHKLFSQMALESPDFWNSMAPDKKRVFRDGMVEAQGANPKDAYSYWEAPIHFRDETQSKSDGVIKEFLNAMERSSPGVLAGTSAGLLTIADEAVKAAKPMADAASKYFAPLFDLKRQYEGAAKSAIQAGKGKQDPSKGSQLELLAKQAREIAKDASIGAETLAPAPKIDQFGKVHGWDDFTMYVAQSLGQQAPIMATMIAGGMVPGIGTGLVFAAGAGLETGSILDDMARNGLEGEDATKAAALYGGLAGLLEAAPLASWMKRTPGVSQSFRQALVARLAEVPIQGLAEAGTEFMQTIVEQTAVDIVNAERGNLEAVSWMTSEGRRSLWDEAKEAAIQGGLVGGIMGGIGGPEQGLGEVENAKKPTGEPSATLPTALLPGAQPTGEPVPGVEPTGPQPGTAPPIAAVGQELGTAGAQELPAATPATEPRPGELATATEDLYGKETPEPIKAPVLVETDQGMATFKERQEKPQETNSWFAPIGKDGMGWAVLNASEGLQSDTANERAVFVEKIDPDGKAVVRDQDGNVDVVDAFDAEGRPNLFAPNSAKGAEYMRQLSAAKSEGGRDIFSEEGGFNAVFNEHGLDRQSQAAALANSEENQMRYEIDLKRHQDLAAMRTDFKFWPYRKDNSGNLVLSEEFKGISPRFFQPKSTPWESRQGADGFAREIQDKWPDLYKEYAGNITGSGGVEGGEIETVAAMLKGSNPAPKRSNYQGKTLNEKEAEYGTLYGGSWTEDQAADIAANRAEAEATGGMNAAQMEEAAAADTTVAPEPFDIGGGLFDENTPTTTQKGGQAVKGEELSPLFGGKQEAAEGPKKTRQEQITDLKASIKELEAVKEKNSGQKAAIAANYRQLRILEKGQKPWEVTKDEFLQGAKGPDEIAIRKAGHANQVHKAVMAGENVPVEVLEDYKNNGWAKTALEKAPQVASQDPAVQRGIEWIKENLDPVKYSEIMGRVFGEGDKPNRLAALYTEIKDEGKEARSSFYEATQGRQAGIEPAGAVPAPEVTKAPESIAPALSPEKRAEHRLADRETTAEEDLVTGQLSMFDTNPPSQRYLDKVKENLGVRLKHIRAAFANTKWTFEAGKDGSIVLQVAGGPKITLMFTEDMIEERLKAHGGSYEQLAKSIGKGYELSEENVARAAEKLQTKEVWLNGSYSFDAINSAHIIMLNRPTAGPDTLFHEAFHFVFKNYLRPSQRKALIEHYGNEEKAAKAYGKLAAARFEGLEKMSVGERILKEVYEFARQMLKYIANTPQSAEDMMEAIYTGQIYEQPWLGVAAAHSTESASGRLRLFPDVFGDTPKLIAREIKGAVEFEDGTLIKKTLSHENYMVELGKAMNEFIPRVLKGRFYSRLAEVVVDAPQKKWGSAGEFMKWVEKQPGVKQEEIYWTGLKEWAEMQEGPITRADAQVYLSNNGVKIEETVRSETSDKDLQDARKEMDNQVEKVRKAARETGHTETKSYEVSDQIHRIGRNLTVLLADKMPDYLERNVSKYIPSELQDMARPAIESVRKFFQLQKDRDATGPKWNKPSLTEPGGKNYRELTIQMRPGEGGGYTSHAFPEKNIIVWVRFNERTDDRGRRVLFIEEIQSDLHQEGKKRGYYDARAPKWEVFDPMMASKIIATFDTEAEAKAYAYSEKGKGLDYAPAGKGYTKGELVPATPFAGNLWPELALKRMMVWAAEEGFDRVSWTTSEQQARRSNQLVEGFTEVKYNPGSSPEMGILSAWDGDRMAGSWMAKPSEIDKYIGAQAAKDLLATAKVNGLHVLPAEGLKVNSSNFASLYDKTLRNIASKLGKKHGVGVDVGRVLTSSSESLPPNIEFEQDPAGLWAWRDTAGAEGEVDWQTGFESKEAAQKDAEKYLNDEIGLTPQQGIDIGGDLREELLGGVTMFELDGGDLDEPVVRVTDPETMYSPETQGPVDGFHDPGVVFSRAMLKEWFREHVIRNLFDKLEPIRHLQETLTEAGKKIDESIDAYLKARNFSAKAGALLNKLENEYFQPLIDKLAALEMPLKQFEEVRMAIHALEANPLMFRRHVVIPRAALQKRIEQLQKAGLRKGMNVRVPGKDGVVGKIASTDKAKGTAVIEWLDRDEGRVRAKEFELTEVERDALAEAKEKMKAIEDMVAADEVPDSGLSSADARTILRQAREHGWVDFEGEPMRKTEYRGKAMQVSALFDKVVTWKEQKLVESSLLSQEELDRWKKDYKYYTPMRGKEPDILDWIYGGDRPPIPEIEYHGSMWYRALDAAARAAGHEGEVHKPNVGRGYNPGSRKPAQRRLGRTSRPTHSPTVELFADAMELAVRSEKNSVAQTVWRLFKSLEHVEDANGKPLFIFDTPPMKRYFDKKTETVKERPDVQALRQPNVYNVWIDGELHFVRSESRELAGLFSVLNNIGPESAPKVLRGVAGINRYIAKMATSRNPAFAIPNAVRDFATAFIRLKTTHKELGTEILKKIPNSAKIIAEYNRLATAGKLGEMDQGTRRRVERWKEAGGETAFWMIPRLQVQAKNMAKELRKASGDENPIWSNGRKVIDFLEDYNGALEGAARFSAFERAIELGASLDKAALVSREITVDFTRQGEWAGWLGSLYVFSNASLQGSRMVYDTLWKTPQGRKWLMGLSSLGFMMGVAGRVFGGDDPDDETAYWDKITAYEKSRNLIFMIPGTDGKRLKIPLPWGFNLPVMAGQMVADAAFSKKVSSFEAAANIMSAGMSAFNPIGDNDLKEASGWWQMLAPSWADPAVDVAFNKTFWGGPIMPERSSFKKSEQYGINGKDHMRYFSSVSKTSKEFTKGLYKLTGLDVSPETVDYMVGALGGGLGDVVNKTINLIPAMSARHSLAAHELPVLRSFYADESEFYAPQTYRANMGHHWEHYEEWQDLKKTNPAEAAAYQRRWAYTINLHDQVKAIEKQASELKKAGVERSDARMQRLFKNFNRLYDRVEANRRRAQRAEPSIMKQ